MLGEKEGFLEGMETTILLTTINKIGGLMQVGFGEAGATVIAKNLADSSGGRLNLMGGGTMIQSIFGFCDVRWAIDRSISDLQLYLSPQYTALMTICSVPLSAGNLLTLRSACKRKSCSS
jgi:hypothetical protein